MPSELAQLVDRVLALTEQVQGLVEDGRWADASALETERLGLLTELFARDDIGEQREQLARDLLSRNGLMIERLGEQRTRLNETGRRLAAAPRAVGAYRENERADAWAERRAG